MINTGLIRRSLREILGVSFTFAIFIGAVSGLLSYALPQVQARFMQRQFIPPGVMQMRNALLGVDTAGMMEVSPIAFSMVMVHPLMLILLFAQAILVCTRMPAGEIERGTVDVLLALPVSRWKLFRSECAAWLVSACVVLGSVMLGSYIGSQFLREDWRPDYSRLAMVLTNLSLVYGAVGCVALAAASGVDRRIRAVMAVIMVTVGSLLINFLEPLWEPAKHVAFLSMLNYYRPFEILSKGEWPVRNLLILGSVCAVLWVTAGVIFARRDVTTT